MASPGGTLSEVYSEDRELIEKLAKLQSMHNQVHNLRGLLPGRLLKPTQAALQHPTRSSPAKLAADLRDTAVQGSKDIRRFAADFRSEAMQQLWQKTSSSEFPQGRDAWNVDYEALQKSSNFNNVSILSANVVTESTEPPEDIEKTIEDFKQANPSVQITHPQPPARFPLDVSVDVTTSSVQFRITREDREGRPLYRVSEQPSDSSPYSKSIVKVISQGEAQTNLQILLSMLKSYRDLKFDTCHKCGLLFDKDLTCPKARRRKPATNKDDTAIEWYPFHESCVT